MHHYHLYHVGVIRKVSSSSRGIEVNTRADFPWFAVDFSGEKTTSEVSEKLRIGEGFLTAFYGDCFFDRKGRRFKSNCVDDTHDCFVAYIEENKVFAIVDQQGWPLTCVFKHLTPDKLPESAGNYGQPNGVMPFRKAIGLTHAELI